MTHSNFITWLQERNHAINTLETQAQQHLKNDNTDAYRAAMLAKAELLAKLADDATPFLPSLPAPYRAQVQARLQRFSQSAEHALELDSIFYMSALLFPEAHQPGQPHDLALFLAEMLALDA